MDYGDHPVMALADGWHAVAAAGDAPAGGAIPVVLGGREIVVWRSSAGVIAAWADRCPHRGMRLSLGFVRGETLSCLYHGWRYGSDGGCVAIPAHPDLTPPATIRAETYPVAEAAGLVFVGLGEVAGTPKVPAGAYGRGFGVTVDRPAEVVAQSLGAQFGTALVRVSPVLEDRCRLLVAVVDGDDAEAALARAEALRRELEGRR